MKSEHLALSFFILTESSIIEYTWATSSETYTDIVIMMRDLEMKTKVFNRNTTHLVAPIGLT